MALRGMGTHGLCGQRPTGRKFGRANCNLTPIHRCASSNYTPLPRLVHARSLAATERHEQFAQQLPKHQHESHRPAALSSLASSASLDSLDAELALLASTSAAASRAAATLSTQAPLQVAPRSQTIGAAAVRGLVKREMQDRHTVIKEFLPDSNVSHGLELHSPAVFAAIFDGHAGCDAAHSAAQRMHELVAQDYMLWAALERWTQIFHQLDDEILCASHKSGRLNGCTALASLCYNGHLIVANTGDSRAVLCRNGKAVRMSVDHCPNFPIERQRIEASGGIVRLLRGTWRVALISNNGLSTKLSAVSRALGDRDFKEAHLMNADPDVCATTLIPGADTFSVLASDGIWGWMSDQEAVDVVNSVLEQFATTPTISRQQMANAAADELVRVAIMRGSYDDITALVQLYA